MFRVRVTTVAVENQSVFVIKFVCLFSQLTGMQIASFIRCVILSCVAGVAVPHFAALFHKGKDINRKIFIERFSQKDFRRKIFIERFPQKDFHRKIFVERFSQKDFHRKIFVERFSQKDFHRKIFIERFPQKDFRRKIFVERF